jgi:hypothetical protein
MAKTRPKTGKTYDPAKAIARWETDGGAPQEGRPSKRSVVRPKPGARPPKEKLRGSKLK